MIFDEALNDFIVVIDQNQNSYENNCSIHNTTLGCLIFLVALIWRLQKAVLAYRCLVSEGIFKRRIDLIEIDNNHGKLVFQLANYEHPFAKEFSHSGLSERIGAV